MFIVDFRANRGWGKIWVVKFMKGGGQYCLERTNYCKFELAGAGDPEVRFSKIIGEPFVCEIMFVCLGGQIYHEFRANSKHFFCRVQYFIIFKAFCFVVILFKAG